MPSGTGIADFNASAERVAPELAQYRHAVVTVPGMATTGAWQKAINTALSDAVVRHEPVDYTFATLGVVWPMTARTIAEVIDKIVAAVESHRGHCPGPPSVIAHSFGSLSFGRALQKRPALSVGRSIVFGSILPTNYPWSSVVKNGQVAGLLNEIGGADPWPVMPFRWLIAGSGSAGRNGFKDLATGAVIQRNNPWTDHSDLGTRMLVREQWLPYMMHGTPPPGCKIIGPTPHPTIPPP